MFAAGDERQRRRSRSASQNSHLLDQRWFALLQEAEGYAVQRGRRRRSRPRRRRGCWRANRSPPRTKRTGGARRAAPRSLGTGSFRCCCRRALIAARGAFEGGQPLTRIIPASDQEATVIGAFATLESIERRRKQRHPGRATRSSRDSRKSGRRAARNRSTRTSGARLASIVRGPLRPPCAIGRQASAKGRRWPPTSRKNRT